jgi:hypothetical protein
MKAKKYCLLVLPAVVAVAACVTAHCDTIVPELMSYDEFGYSALRGISGVKVEAVHLFSAFEDDKLRRNPIIVEDLQAYAEQLLANGGIWVCQNTSQGPNAAKLVITVNTWETVLISEFIVQVKAQLYQDAELVAGNRLRLMARTWPVGDRALEANMTEVIRLREMRREVAQQVQHQVGMFISDYRMANPGACRPLMTGTVRYMGIHYANFEWGSYGIVADNGRKYIPAALPEEYAVDGLRVRFQLGRIIKPVIPGRWGDIVELMKIGRL